MDGLSSADLRGALEFLDAAWSAAGDEPFTPETLRALQHLVPCDAVTYAELDHVSRRSLAEVSTEPADAGDDELFWQLEREHPLCRHQQAYEDFSAKRLSDVASARRFRGSRVYGEWFRPLGIAAELEVGIRRSRVRTRNFVLDRSSGDFSDRDCRVLDLLAPHLARIHTTSALRAQLAHAQAPALPLTAREVEVLELVASGLTNAAIAERLWIAPGTVKKHLDNVYEKLGVSSRAAAAAAVARATA